MGILDSGWLIATISLSIPILLAATGELVAEKTGVFNIGIDGMMVAGAFFSFYVTWLTGSPWVGLLGGLLGGVALSIIVGLVSVSGTGNQVVVGTGVWIIGFGLTSFLNARIFSQGDQVIVETMQPLKIPILSDLPLVGEALFDQIPLTYLAFFAIFAVAALFRYTNWGLIVRSAGEAPAAVDNAGISVTAVRWVGVLVGGAFAGLGGAMLVIGSSGTFTTNVTVGQGFIALGAVFFGRWMPMGVLGACLVFGGANALQLRLQTTAGVPSEVWILVALIPLLMALRYLQKNRRLPGPGSLATAAILLGGGMALALLEPGMSIPTQVWLMVPYIVTIVVLASVSGSSHGPRALAQHYQRAA